MKTNTIRRFITIAFALTITLAMGAGWAHAELKDNNNGTITDTAQGLVWLKNADCFGLQNQITAMYKAAYLSSGACGLSDKSSAGQWRLPTKEELRVRSANTAGFTNVQSSYCWATVGVTGYVGVVRMGMGYVVDYKQSGGSVWPVRAEQ